MILRVQISFQFDTAFPRDAITINPHFFGDDPQAIVDHLKTNLLALPAVGATTPFTIKAYNAQQAPPSYPLATASNLSGFVLSHKPREVALCLSYYSTYNRPSYRGRLYIPGVFISGTFDVRPTATQQADAMKFKDVLSTNMPAGMNWVVYSRRQNKSYGVSNCWVDDEWDTIRSRGMKGTTRILASVP